MAGQHACGPESDKEFFSDLEQVLRRHPEAAKKYQIACADHEMDLMGIDFEKRGALQRIEGDRVITEFKDRAELEARGGCCKWCLSASWYCCAWWT